MTQHFVPHDYQHDIRAHIFNHLRCAVWAGMGTGKTVSTATALADLDLVEPVFPALILAPKRVAQSTWPDEFLKWAELNHLTAVFVGGTVKQREAALRVKADFYCMAYDNLVWLVDHLGDDWPFLTVVGDELTRLKSFRIRQGSKRAGALGKVAHSKVKRFIGLTGTPAPNGLKDLWGQVWFLDKGERLGRTFSAFEQRWFARGRDGFSLEPLPHAQAEIEALLSDLCLTVTGLPVDKPICNNVYVDMPPAAAKSYREMEQFMWTQLAGEHDLAAEMALTKTNVCRQLASGAAYVGDPGANREWVVTHDAKLDALESIIEEAAGMPVLVAYDFQSDLARILKRFPQARHLDADPATIRRWNDGKIPVLVAHAQSAGHGLNLQYGGNILAFFGLNWSLENYEQIIERIGPMRQKQAGFDRPVFVHHIIARGTIDEDVLDRLAGKKTVQQALLDAMQRRKK